MPETAQCSSCTQALPIGISQGLCASCLSELLSSAQRKSKRKRKFPRSFGDYQLVERIAMGGMGIVYKARQKEPNRIVALKMIRSRRLPTETEVERFRAEAQAVAKLDHPHIIPLYQVGEHRGRHYFTMRFMEGGSLKAHLPRLRNDQRKAAAIVATVARAVDYSHAHGIVHRDLKPTNILLDSEDRPYVGDFGLAKEPHHDAHLTLTGAVVGTPAYMAPEQAMGNRITSTPSADIFSLGAILYELLTGQPPLAPHTQGRPSSINPRVDPELETICLKCLESDPSRRYPSAEALAQALEQFIATSPSPPKPTTRLAVIVRWTKRHLALTAVLAALLVLALSVATGSLLHKGPPVVVLMDTPVARGVYDPDIVARGGTNADELNERLRDLPIALSKEALPSTWDRESQILALRPDLVIIHRSGFFHALNAEFRFGYPPFAKKEDEDKWMLLYRTADDKLIGFLGLVGTNYPGTRFIVYSRGTDGHWTDAEYRKEWVTRVEQRFPALHGRITVMLIPGGAPGGTFRDPAVSKEIREHIQNILGLPSK